jgi:hypothetical protein
LAQQNLLSCIQRPNECHGYYPSEALKYIKNNGIVTEECFPYEGTNLITCADLCSQPVDNLSINSYEYISSNDIDIIKQKLIEEGPLTSAVMPWSHAMSLIGYGQIQAGSLYFNGTSNDYSNMYVVPENSPLIGRTYWIFLQSWGSWIDQTPFVYVLMNEGQGPTGFGHTYSLDLPITSNIYSADSIKCRDMDGDGYYFWGIGPKPSTCPIGTPSQPDCDDSKAYIGPFGSDFSCEVNCNHFTLDTITPLVISNSITWVDDLHINQNIIIENDAVLSIKSKINIASNGKIIINPGAKLILDGGVLTNTCGEPWQGIYVEGDRTLHQTFANQGAVILQNGAIIENAKDAVMLRGVADNWWGNGGIIQATDATFRNNWRNVSFNSYEFPSISYFHNCVFETNADTQHNTHTANVSIWNVQGLTFTNCDFKDTRPNIDYFSYRTSRDGIYSYDDFSGNA